MLTSLVCMGSLKHAKLISMLNIKYLTYVMLVKSRGGQRQKYASYLTQSVMIICTNLLLKKGILDAEYVKSYELVLTRGKLDIPLLHILILEPLVAESI